MNNDLLNALLLRKVKLSGFLRATFILLLFILLSLPGGAQTNNVKGKVIDSEGEPVIGATVVVIDSNPLVGTSTDADGEFSLNAPLGAKLKISFLSMRPQEVVVSDQRIEVVLLDDEIMLNEMVVIGYGKQSKVSVVGSVTSTSGKELVKAPVGNLGMAMVGRLNGLVAVQESGIPGGDSPRLNIRGTSTLNDNAPLIIVDGVESAGGGHAQKDPSDPTGSVVGNISGWESINVNDVESISILKDASATAVYGVRGANGVIIITTKRGQTGKPVVSYSFSHSLSQPTNLKQPLNAYETMLYANEGNYNDGQAVAWDFDLMNKYRYHVNDILYPDVDINKYVLRDVAPKTSHNISVRGGTDRVRYFVSLGQYNEKGLLKENDAYGFNPNNIYNRTNVRTNLDFQFTKRLSFGMNIDTRFEKRSGATSPGNEMFWTYMYMSVPWISPGFDNQGHTIISNRPLSADGFPIFMKIQNGGSYDREQITANTQFSGKYELDQLTPGLSVSAKYAFDSFSDSWSITRRAHAYYDVQKDQESGEPIYIKQGYDGEQLIFNMNPDKRKKYYLEGALNYEQTFAKDHTVTALALYNQERRYYYESVYTDIPVTYLGFVGRATYDYKNRYLAEFNIGINGSENFQEGERFGVFPAFSLGWVISQENFMKQIKPLSLLKLRASYGKVGSDRIGGYRFLYIGGNYANMRDMYRAYFGEQNNVYGGNGMLGLQEGTGANENVTWEVATKYNIGLDSRFFKDRLSFTLDMFKEKRTNILTPMETLPGFLYPSFTGGTQASPYVTSYITPVNYAEVHNKGFDIEVEWRDDLNKDFGYDVKLSMSYSKNKAIKLSEAEREYPWMYNQGLPLNTLRGFIAEGYWQSYEEINRQDNVYNTYAPHPVPGDIKYKDINGDMKIDDKDMVPLDYSNVTPRTVFSASFGVNYKGFDLSVLLQGATKMLYLPSGFSQRLGQGGDKAVFDWIEDRWTPNNRDGDYPRLQSFSSMNENSSNFQPSTYWAYDNTYVRLKNIQLGYTIPENFSRKLFISNARITLTGQNLYTWVKDKRMKRFDPEAWSAGGGLQSYYPIMKIYSLGINLTF